MCLFFDLNFNSTTWTFLIMAAVISASIMAFYGQFKDILHGLDEERRRSADMLFIQESIKKLKNEICVLKDGVKESEKEVKTLQKEIQLFKSDKTGMVDFAFKGEVISIRNTEVFQSEGTVTMGFCGNAHLERRILESSVMPGDCWPIRGQEGSAVIALTSDVIVTKVTLEHASKALLPRSTVLAAPKLFSLWGLQDENDHEDSPTAHFFGQFEYSLNKPEVQTFFVTHPSNNTFRFVEFKVLSNHGHPNFTCVYRVRVHGHLLL